VYRKPATSLDGQILALANPFLPDGASLALLPPLHPGPGARRDSSPSSRGPEARAVGVSRSSVSCPSFIGTLVGHRLISLLEILTFSSLSPSHHNKYTKRHMFGVLNIGKKTNYTVLMYFATQIF
jgi:hypothetical protein